MLQIWNFHLHVEVHMMSHRKLEICYWYSPIQWLCSTRRHICSWEKHVLWLQWIVSVSWVCSEWVVSVSLVSRECVVSGSWVCREWVVSGSWVSWVGREWVVCRERVVSGSWVWGEYVVSEWVEGWGIIRVWGMNNSTNTITNSTESSKIVCTFYTSNPSSHSHVSNTLIPW